MVDTYVDNFDIEVSKLLISCRTLILIVPDFQFSKYNTKSISGSSVTFKSKTIYGSMQTFFFSIVGKQVLLQDVPKNILYRIHNLECFYH